MLLLQAPVWWSGPPFSSGRFHARYSGNAPPPFGPPQVHSKMLPDPSNVLYTLYVSVQKYSRCVTIPAVYEYFYLYEILLVISRAIPRKKRVFTLEPIQRKATAACSARALPRPLDDISASCSFYDPTKKDRRSEIMTLLEDRRRWRCLRNPPRSQQAFDRGESCTLLAREFVTEGP